MFKINRIWTSVLSAVASTVFITCVSANEIDSAILADNTSQINIQEQANEYIERYEKGTDTLDNLFRKYSSVLNLMYIGNFVFQRGLYHHAFWWDYSTANVVLPTTVGLIRETDAEILMTISNDGCLLFKNSHNNNQPSLLTKALAGYKAALAFHEFEKKETGLSMPPEFMADLQHKIKATEELLEFYSQSQAGTCLDLKLALKAFDNQQELIEKIKAQPDFLHGPCPYFQESEIDVWPDKQEVAAIDTPLGNEYIKIYMGNIPQDYKRAPHAATKEDFEKIKAHFINAANSLWAGDFYYSRKMYDKAYERLDIAVNNIPSFINLNKRADAKVMLLINTAKGQLSSQEVNQLKEQLTKVINEYEAALTVYKFEKCEELISIPLMEMAIVGDKIKCLKNNLAADLAPDNLAACLIDSRPIYKKCLDLVNPCLWDCPGEEI